MVMWSAGAVETTGSEAPYADRLARAISHYAQQSPDQEQLLRDFMLLVDEASKETIRSLGCLSNDTDTVNQLLERWAYVLRKRSDFQNYIDRDTELAEITRDSAEVCFLLCELQEASSQLKKLQKQTTALAEDVSWTDEVTRQTLAQDLLDLDPSNAHIVEERDFVEELKDISENPSPHRLRRFEETISDRLKAVKDFERLAQHHLIQSRPLPVENKIFKFPHVKIRANDVTQPSPASDSPVLRLRHRNDLRQNTAQDQPQRQRISDLSFTYVPPIGTSSIVQHDMSAMRRSIFGPVSPRPLPILSELLERHNNLTDTESTSAQSIEPEPRVRETAAFPETPSDLYISDGEQ